MTFGLFFELFLQMFRDPRTACRRVLDLNWPPEAVWYALGLVTILGIPALKLVEVLSGQSGELVVLGIPVDPAIGLAVGQSAVLIVAAWLLAVVGRRLGGKGGFAEALTMVTWLQVSLLTLQALQILLLLAMPPVAALVSLLTLFVIMWWMTAVVAATHGFTDMFRTFLGMLAGITVLLVVSAFLFGLFGVDLSFGAGGA